MAVLGHLTHDQEKVRFDAIRVLGRLVEPGDPHVVAALLRLQEYDPDFHVRGKANDVLADIIRLRRCKAMSLGLVHHDGRVTSQLLLMPMSTTSASATVPFGY